ncbi:MAG: hormogonium polysaccharide biosynthesis glycosyltransferase HpsE [Spirulinaceae cyanobacterium]
MAAFTVAIRACNGEKYLPLILDKLKEQVNIENIDWEIVIVDNNSTDNTAKIIKKYQSDWPKPYPLKYYFEAEQSAFLARKRAIKEARGDLIGFLDDDNIPASNWVEEAYSFGQSHPQVAAYGSQIHGEYEVEPPPNFERIAGFIPIIERPKAICFNHYLYGKKGLLPPGAGLVIRKKVWLENVPEKLHFQGPVGKSLGAKGEDIEALIHIKKAGKEIWYNPKMAIFHQIPKTRFDREYLRRFFRGIGSGRYRLRMARYKSWQRPFMTLLYIVNDLRKVIFHFFKYRTVLATDVVAAGEMELYLSTLASPFLGWQKRITAIGKAKIKGKA